MSKATYPLKLPLSVKKAAQRLAKEDGVSLNQWIAVAVAEKVPEDIVLRIFKSDPARLPARDLCGSALRPSPASARRYPAVEFNGTRRSPLLPAPPRI
jgi:hypothetical protein